MTPWNDIKKGIPTPADHDKFVLFVEFREPWNEPLRSAYGTWEFVKNTRKRDVIYKFTHWMFIDKPKKQEEKATKKQKKD